MKTGLLVGAGATAMVVYGLLFALLTADRGGSWLLNPGVFLGMQLLFAAAAACVVVGMRRLR